MTTFYSSEILHSPGIYCIMSTGNPKCYVGSSRSISNRVRQHFSTLRCGTHQNTYLQRAYDKRGECVWFAYPLEYCSEETLHAREAWWMEVLQPFGNGGYNLSTDPRAPARGWARSAETIVRMRTSMLGKHPSAQALANMSVAKKGKPGHPTSDATRAKLSKALKGHPVSEETRRKFAKAREGYKPLPHTQEARHKMSLKAWKTKTWPGFVRPDGTQTGPIRNLNAFCKENGLGSSALGDVARGSREQYKGWRRISDDLM